MITHELKVHPQFWQATKRCEMPFQIRRNDRAFKVGDICVLREYDPKFGYVDRNESVAFPITFVLHHEDFPNGLQPGFVALGFGVLSMLDDGR